MAISRKPTISSEITQQATDLLANARKYCNNDQNIDGAYVTIEVLKGTQMTLSNLCEKAISDNSTRKSVEGILKKAQNKLQRAEQLNTFLRSDNKTGIDPRVERIMKKIADQKLTSYSSSQTKAIHEKLTKWDSILRTCSLLSNAPTKQTAASGRSSISEIDMELLQHAPHIVTFNHSLRSGSSDHFYKPYSVTGNALPNREECIKLASAFYAKRYLISFASSGLDNPRFDSVGPDRDMVEHAHRSTAEHLKIFRCSDGISAEQLFQERVESLKAVSFPASFSCKEISFPSNANVEEVQKQIDNLIALKSAYRLNWISAFIEIKPQMLAIVLHPSGRISLVNPCGSKTNPNSYEANFANSKQAAEFLKNLIGEMGTNNRIVFKPYSKAGAIPKIEESTSSSSSSSSALDSTLLDPVWVSIPSTAEAKHPTLVEMFPGMTPIKECIQALSQRNDEGFFQSLLPLDKLSQDYWTWTDGADCPSLARIYSHLYLIQDLETPEKIDRNDKMWGKTALLTKALSTPDEKLRAVQRVRLEELVHSLSIVIKQGRGSDNFVQLLDELEQLKLNPNDLPRGQTNAAHALFGKFYQVYTKAREQDPSLDDPNDEKFKGDFGRCTFRDYSGNEMIKIDALNELAKDLKAAWRI